jgi:hypothetical protein
MNSGDGRTIVAPSSGGSIPSSSSSFPTGSSAGGRGTGAGAGRGDAAIGVVGAPYAAGGGTAGDIDPVGARLGAVSSACNDMPTPSVGPSPLDAAI